MKYNKNNVFAKIINKEINAKIIYESQHVLCFEDIKPLKQVHTLIIPKGSYISIEEMNQNASNEEITELFQAISEVVKIKKIDQSGYRIIINNGEDGCQEVPHLHLHVVGGEKLTGPIV